MGNPALRPLPYHRNIAPVLGVLANCSGLVCLDSGLAPHASAQYDIISAWPTTQWRSQRGDGLDSRLYQRCDGDSQWRHLSDNNGSSILHRAEAWQRENRPAPASLQTTTGLPFCGGLIGWLGYHTTQDSANGLNPAHYTTNAPDESRAALNAMPDAEVGFYDWAIVVDHRNQKSWLAMLPDCPATIRERVAALERELFGLLSNDAVQVALSSFKLTSDYQPLTTKQQYLNSFERIQDWIRAGDCYQVNLSIAFAGRFRGDPLDAYLELRERSQSPFSAFIRHDEGAILSLSPERFFSVRSRRVEAQPIKGTRPRHSDPDIDNRLRAELLTSEKDRAENLMIVDLLRNDLGKLCETGSISTPKLFEMQSFSQVHHLVSTITGTLPSDSSALELLYSAFPGGSITGAPKTRAMQIIGELEPVQRSVYCGSVFYQDVSGNMDSNICIRTLVCQGEHVFCWAGSGIVADSQGDEEYQECHDKVAALLGS